jgi:rare lipoprotein A
MKKTIISFLILLIPLSASAEIGIASYYGKQFHGRKTANGEKFNMHALTAAHKSLPFNTIVTVTNLSNNSSIKVRINDRGPFVKGRIIDLSKKAAKLIGIDGIAKVKIDIINTES